MGMGFPVGMGFPWDSHGNGNERERGGRESLFAISVKQHNKI